MYDLKNIQKIIDLDGDIVSDGTVIDMIDSYIRYRNEGKSEDEAEVFVRNIYGITY